MIHSSVFDLNLLIIIHIIFVLYLVESNFGNYQNVVLIYLFRTDLEYWSVVRVSRAKPIRQNSSSIHKS